MIERYTRPEMGRMWSDENKFRAWLEVELAVCEVLTRQGLIPESDMAVIRDKADFDLKRIDEIDAEVHHDVIAFLTSVAEHVGPPSRHIHFGLTSSDVVDTAQALLMVRSVDLLLAGLDGLIEATRRRAIEHRHTVMVGRTHGIHAEPYTMGLKFASWHEEATRNRRRLEAARAEISHAKISGSVGTYAHLGPEVEAEVLDRLGLRVEPVSTQVVPRDRHAIFASAMGVLASSLDRIATEVRHLQRTDVREVEEPFKSGQKGSSSMPHKRNPVRCENVSGLARVVRANVQAALENVPLWHERDISHSSVERVIIPDSTILCDFMLSRMTRIVDGLIVYPDAMLTNLDRMKGLVFSQAVLLGLTRAGVSREDAYAIVQRNAMAVWEGKGTFKELLAADAELREALDRDALDACFAPERFLQHVDTIYERVFGAV